MVEISGKGHWKDESQQRRAEIAALLKASHAVLKYREFKDVARAIFDSCKKLIGARAGYVTLLSKDESQIELLFLDAGGLPCTVDPSLPMPLRGLRGDAYRTGKAVYDNDFSNSEWMKYMPEGHAILENVLFAPMVLEGKAVGLLGLANKSGGFTENDAWLASVFGEFAAVALLNSRTLELLKNSEKKYRDIVDNALVGIYKSNLRGELLYANKTLAKMFEFDSPEEMMQAGILPRYKNPKDRETLIESLKKTGRLNDFQLEVLTKTGKPKNILVSATLEGNTLSGMIIDISERLELESSLKKRVKELEMFYDMAVGREVKMTELKEEIERLKKGLKN